MNHRPLFDEEAGHFDGLGQQTSTVAPEIQHHAGDFFLLESLEDRRHVASAVLVKLGQIDHAEAGTRAVLLRVIDDLSLGQAVGQIDLVTDQAHFLRLALVGGIHRDDGEANQCAFLAANLVDHLVEFHLNYIHRITVLALGDSDDTVARLQFLAADGRAAGDEFDQLGVTIVPLQPGADAGEGELDVVDFEILRLERAEVVGVWVVAVGEGGEINLQHVAGVHLGPDAEEALVTAHDFLLFGLDVVRLDRCAV